MRLTLLGTGHAMTTACYNTCFALTVQGRHLLVDGGGGSGLPAQAKAAGIVWRDVDAIFCTHKHIDHLLGVIWAARAIMQDMFRGTRERDLAILAHPELAELIARLLRELIREEEACLVGSRVHIQPLGDGEERRLLGRRTVFFDIGSDQDKQFGFAMDLKGPAPSHGPGDPEEPGRLVCLGDEPLHPAGERYARGASLLMHEAFCLALEAERFHPYEKRHSTARDACLNAARMQARAVLLYHTEDSCLAQRKMRYQAEGREVFGGAIYVPDDLESLELDEDSP